SISDQRVYPKKVSIGHGCDATASSYRPQRLSKQTLQRRDSGACSCHNRTRAPQQIASLFGGLGGFHNSRQPDRESRSAAGLALDRDVAPHHLTEALANRETKPSAAILARRRRGRLGKLMEQLAHLFRRHPNPRVGN